MSMSVRLFFIIMFCLVQERSWYEWLLYMELIGTMRENLMYRRRIRFEIIQLSWWFDLMRIKMIMMRMIMIKFYSCDCDESWIEKIPLFLFFSVIPLAIIVIVIFLALFDDCSNLPCSCFVSLVVRAAGFERNCTTCKCSLYYTQTG